MNAGDGTENRAASGSEFFNFTMNNLSKKVVPVEKQMLKKDASSRNAVKNSSKL